MATPATESSLTPAPGRGLRVLACISDHGLGHLGQLSPVLRELANHFPECDLHIQSTIAPGRLEEMLGLRHQQHGVADDHGLLMANSLDVKLDATVRAYALQHQNWDALLTATVTRFAAIAPDVVIANAPYLSIAGAAALGLPSVLLASFTWAHAYRAYCSDSSGAAACIDHMLTQYRKADLILQPEPSMPMPELSAGRSIGPLARLGRPCRPVVEQRLGMTAGQRLVLLFLGGVDTPLPLQDWPHDPNLVWVVSHTPSLGRPDFRSIEECGVAYIDLLASADALVTKPGYGSIAEAACNGIPVLYVRRGRWPEEPGLIDWLKRHGRSGEIDRATLESGALRPALEALWTLPQPTPPVPSGALDATRAIAGLLAQSA